MLQALITEAKDALVQMAGCHDTGADEMFKQLLADLAETPDAEHEVIPDHVS